MPHHPGRPRLASRELLQEAAFELFQVRGYRRTSVDLIARTAGFSRATFFNVFRSKAELLWLETDTLIADLRAHLATRPPITGRDQLHAELRSFAAGIASGSIPWSLQNWELLGADDELVASGATRVLALHDALRHALLRGGVRETAASADAAVTAALVITALRSWIDAGVHRGSLTQHLTPALARVESPVAP